MRRSIATVCLSGTLEDKLEAAAEAGFDEVELFEPDLIASALSPEQVRDRADDLGLTIGLYQPFRDFEAVPDLRDNLRRAEHKFAVMERLGADLLLVCSNVSARSARRRRPRRRAAPHARRARRRARHPDRLRGARLGPPRQRLRARVADRRASRPPEPRHVPRLVPHPLARQRPGEHPRHPRRQDLLPPARRRAGAGDGRPAVEPPLPLLPGPGRVRPRGVRAARARDRVRRPAVARGLQRRLPPGRPTAHGDRRDALAAPARGGRRRRTAARRPHRSAATRSSSSP